MAGDGPIGDYRDDDDEEHVRAGRARADSGRYAESSASDDSPVHPVPAMQEAFEESIQEAADGEDDTLRLSRDVSAEARRRELLDQETYDASWTTRWKQRPHARWHPIVKLMSQIIFGLHLLHQRQAKSEAEVVKILQTHVDEIDAFLEKTTEDFDLAMKDIDERISFLKLPMTHVEVFDIMLEDKKFRTQLIDGNDKIEKIIERTAKAMNAALLDVQKAVNTTQMLSEYLDSVQDDWPHETPDQSAIFMAMKGNDEGWRGCLRDLQGKGHKLGVALVQLGTVVGEMSKLAGAASRRHRSPTPSPQSPVFRNIQQPRQVTIGHGRKLSIEAVNKPLPKEPDARGAAVKATIPRAHTLTVTERRPKDRSRTSSPKPKKSVPIMTQAKAQLRPRSPTSPQTSRTKDLAGFLKNSAPPGDSMRKEEVPVLARKEEPSAPVRQTEVPTPSRNEEPSAPCRKETIPAPSLKPEVSAPLREEERSMPDRKGETSAPQPQGLRSLPSQKLSKRPAHLAQRQEEEPMPYSFEAHRRERLQKHSAPTSRSTSRPATPPLVDLSESLPAQDFAVKEPPQDHVDDDQSKEDPRHDTPQQSADDSSNKAVPANETSTMAGFQMPDELGPDIPLLQPPPVRPTDRLKRPDSAHAPEALMLRSYHHPPPKPHIPFDPNAVIKGPNALTAIAHRQDTNRGTPPQQQVYSGPYLIPEIDSEPIVMIKPSPQVSELPAQQPASHMLPEVVEEPEEGAAQRSALQPVENDAQPAPQVMQQSDTLPSQPSSSQHLVQQPFGQDPGSQRTSNDTSRQDQHSQHAASHHTVSQPPSRQSYERTDASRPSTDTSQPARSQQLPFNFSRPAMAANFSDDSPITLPLQGATLPYIQPPPAMRTRGTVPIPTAAQIQDSMNQPEYMRTAQDYNPRALHKVMQDRSKGIEPQMKASFESRPTDMSSIQDYPVPSEPAGAYRPMKGTELPKSDSGYALAPDHSVPPGPISPSRIPSRTPSRLGLFPDTSLPIQPAATRAPAYDLASPPFSRTPSVSMKMRQPSSGNKFMRFFKRRGKNQYAYVSVSPD